ncbi:MAG: succinate dehydrogenase, cytochrome b556 subunit [Rhodospirillales bacterium]|nr:succinate dehydrogenase, cytochrome b556 subunit [Rhodospirillales bacterium]
MAEAAPPPRTRPISPFLFPPTGTYRWQITSTMSILHRLSGIALGFGALLLTWWLLALLGEPADFAEVQAFLGSIFGRLLLLGWTWSLFYHLLNGVRHLVWDTGHGLELPSVYRGGWTVIVLSVVLTVAAWLAGYWFR